MNDHTAGIETYVRSAWLPRLAPVVDHIASRLGPRREQAERARPSTRKVLAFDEHIRAWGILATVVFSYAVGNAIIGFGSFLAGKENGLPQFVITTIVALLAAVVGLFGMASRVARLRRLFLNSVTISGRVAREASGTWWQSPSVELTVEYPHPRDGDVREARIQLLRGKHLLVRPAPELLVDSENPPHIFIRDLYV
jgi:hypothetical protein